MSDENNIFEKYVKEKRTLSQFLKEPKSWVIIVTTLAAIIIIIMAYKSIFLDKMSPEEIKNSIQVMDLESGWVESGKTAEGVKIVPMVKFKIKNAGERALRYVTLEGIFQFEQPGKAYFDGVAQACQEPLPPGEVSEEIFIKSHNGYTASSKLAFLQNKENWEKMNVRIFAKTSGTGPIAVVDKFPVKQVIEGMEDMVGEESKEELEELAKNTEEFAKSVDIKLIETKWYDKKISAGNAIIVPSITLTVKNLSQEPLQDIVFKCMFVFTDTGQWLSDGLLQALKKPLPPGETSEEILVKADHGYKASSKEAFIKNRANWKMVKVKVFARSMDSDYALLGTYPVSREIQGIKVRYHYTEK